MKDVSEVVELKRRNLWPSNENLGFTYTEKDIARFYLISLIIMVAFFDHSDKRFPFFLIRITIR